ncbi:hypothetical protein SAMN05444167_1812 [Terriglobus roseus]|uniref:Histidine kinase/HSP90-like ATPase domain-containing protein n=2 Tax=Terriglobus roseus TaxID=392734 RepID=A0A1G7JHJ4_9BACT|nr:hypothetical protein SAMN05444167_1812 [Terriglobus roseus]
MAASEIGPIFELGLLSKAGLVPWPGDSGWLHLNGVASLMAGLAKRKHFWTCPSTRAMGLYRTYVTPPSDESLWIEFGVAAQYCATQAGFSRDESAQLVGAIGEMQSNIYEHSKASSTGIVAFKGSPGTFEFVLADRGIGVLESLRACSEYSHLTSHGQALQMTLTEGVSRHGSSSGRGLGFRPLFRGLSNLSGSLRFRSGDYALTIDGKSPGIIPAKLWQKPSLKGFFASIVCRC